MSAATDLTLRTLVGEVRSLLEVQGAWGLEGLDVPAHVLERAQRRTRSATAEQGAVPQGSGSAPQRASAPQREAAAPQAPSLPMSIPSDAVPPPDLGPRPTLSEVEKVLGDCTRCKLAPHRTHLVFGVGRPDARLMIVGEAPGRDEDLQGEPFVGAAGQLLDRMLVAMGMARQDVYIANMLKCRPPKNRFPEADELASCAPFVLQQIRAVGPEVLLILGRCAAQALLHTTAPLGRLRGQWTEVLGVRALPSFHPAYLLRNPADKKLAWQDLQLVMAALA